MLFVLIRNKKQWEREAPYLKKIRTNQNRKTAAE
jgi:hypothetical protein